MPRKKSASSWIAGRPRPHPAGIPATLSRRERGKRNSLLIPVTKLPPAPARPEDAHKGSFGTVVVVGGSPTMIGAPALCAGAALRAGAGLVKIATRPASLPFALTIEPSATGIAWAAGTKATLVRIDQADPQARAVLAVGPGLGQSSQAAKLVSGLLRGQRPMVLDADGLNLLAKTGKPRPDGPPLIMTPHPGEFGRLAHALGIEQSPVDPKTRPRAAAALALAHRAVVVLKGHRTVVSDGRHLYVNQTGNVALATAGSGDILTGLIAGLLAQGMSPLDAAVLGVHLHGMAADIWRSKWGPSGLTARDLAGLLPEAFARRRSALPRGR